MLNCDPSDRFACLSIPYSPGGRLHVSCVPMREQKTMRKGIFFRAGQFAVLSSFRVGKMLFL